MPCGLIREWRRAGAAGVGLALAFVVGACGGVATPERPTVNVFAAISLTEPLERLAAQFQTATGITVALNFAGSNTLATQILNGGPADVFFSADEAQMDRVAQAGLVAADTRKALLSNRLVVIVPKASTLTVAVPADLAGQGVTRFAIADPAAVPAGRYAAAYLKARGVWPSLESRLVYFPHVRAASTAVEQGAASAGMIYRTDARASSGVRVLLEIDEDPRWVITYPAAVTARAPHPGEARRFLAFLQAVESLRLFEESGFVVLPAS